MRWQGRQGSGNVEDRRGGGGGRKVGAGLGIGSIIILLIAFLTGGNPMQLLQQMGDGGGMVEESAPGAAPQDELGQFVSVVLKDTEDTWNTVLPQQVGANYQEPVLVLYEGSVQSACGMGSTASGPFYCPGDYKLYIDLSFYQELKDRFRAPGDFAMAYVVAHEVGHHVQNLLGITRQVDSKRGKMSKEDFNALSVRLELQADFFAGVWAHYTQQKNLLEEGDIEEALRAANAIGDDRIQKESMGYVMPESFTHGTSEQRMRWFMKGYKTGDMNQGDTFAAREL